MPWLWRRSRQRLAAVDVGTAYVRVGTPDEPLRVERTAQSDRHRHAMRAGVVTDVDAMAEVLGSAIEEAGVARRDLVVSAPASIGQLERVALLAALRAAGVEREPVVIEEPVAAAIGLGLDIADEVPRLIVDVGHGITEAAIISNGGIQALASVPVGCAQLLVMDVDGEAATPNGDGPEPAAPGRSDDQGPVNVALAQITKTVEGVLASAAVYTAAAVDRLYLVGGGSLVAAVGHRLTEATGLPIDTSPSPLHTVIQGDAVCAVTMARHSARDSTRRGRRS